MSNITKKLKEVEILPHDCPKDAWLEQRMNGIGGSDISSVLNVNPWKTSLETFLEKTGQQEPSPAKIIMEVGSYMEPFIREKFFENESDVKRIDPVGMIPHEQYPFLFANVDDLAIDEHGSCVVEYKNVGSFAQKAWKDNSIPHYYWCQVQWYLGILSSHFDTLEFDHAYFGVLIGNRDLDIRYVVRDDVWFEKAVEKARVFWERVQDDDLDSVVLDVDPNEYSFDAFSTAYPGDKNEEAVELSEEQEDVLADYENIVSQIEYLKSQQQKKKAEILSFMKNATKCVGTRYKASWPAIAGRKRVDVKEVMEAHPEIDYSKFEKEGNAYRGALKITQAN